LKIRTRFRSLFVASFLASTLGIAVPMLSTPRAAYAQAALAVGVVDEDKLADGYDKYKAEIDKLDKRAQDLDTKIPAREFLNDEEGKKFDGFIVQPNLSAADKTALDALVKLGLDRRAEYMGLVGKAVRTDPEKTRMNTLQEMMTKNSDSLRGISDKLLAAIRQQQDTVDKQFTDKANSVVQQVAADKKLSIIVRKKALVWSADSVDITSEVLNRLNKS
jgi:Skp family chaperone for outer membrane proteins